MPHISPFATFSFVALTLLLAAVFVLAVKRAGGGYEAPTMARRWANRAWALSLTWLGGSALLAATGVLQEFNRRPPPLMIFVFTLTLATAAVAFSPLGTRLLKGVSIAWLIGFQVFRFPLELWLHRIYQEGVIPVQMTYAGRNYDIITGLLALVFVIRARKQQPSRWAVRAFNLIGLALLINIVTIAVFSAPTPFRQFHNEPANTFVAYVPFVWLPAFLVQAAWFGHLLVFRWLWRSAKR